MDFTGFSKEFYRFHFFSVQKIIQPAFVGQSDVVIH